MNKQLVKYYANHYIAPPLLLLSSGKNSSNKQKYFSSSARFYAGLEMLVKIAKQVGVNDGRAVKMQAIMGLNFHCSKF